MNKIQKFALDNIYCAPGQDQQFSFSLVRVNNVNQPALNSVNVYNVTKRLPNVQYRYHVFVIGNLNPLFLNLLRQGKDWFRDSWVKVSEDMVARNYVLKIYDDAGVMFPREFIYYSFIDENSIVIALEFEQALKNVINVNSFKYMHVYSNSYFDSSEFLALPVKLGIRHSGQYVFSNADKLNMQNTLQGYEANGGKALVYVNGLYTDSLNLNIPNNSYVEFIYDQSIISKEKFLINDLRTFDSTKDNKVKYLLFRNNIIDEIQYKDDTEIYISNDNELVTKGVFFYQHQDHAVRNVTDKDFSLYTSFVNNAAQTVTNLTTGAIQDKIIVLYTRKAGVTRDLVYSSLKLHELYKLPQNVELDVMCSNGYTLTELRAETLENSDYFKVASLNGIKNLSVDLSVGALGYSGAAYYFANTPTRIEAGDNSVDVPVLYQEDSLAFEYDSQGKMLGHYATSGPVYLTNNATTRYVEFLYGRTPLNYGSLLANDGSTTLLHSEYRVVSAYFNGVNRIANWEDITNDTNRCNVVGNTLNITDSDNYKAKVIYLNQPNVYDIQVDISDGMMYIPLTVTEDRGTGMQLFPADVPFSNIELYLNGNKLVPNLDFFINFPYVSITNKEHLDYSSVIQNVHIRMYGFTLDKDKINSQEKTGFVNHGVLLRNNSFDIRDDKVMSVYIKGKLHNRSNITYAEEDNTVRLTNPINGHPYVIKEPFIALKTITDKDTLPLFDLNVETNKKVSDLFNVVFPEPDINEFNVISDHYYIFSPTLSKIINDLIDENIAPSLYTTPYNDGTIVSLLDESPYKELLALDPIRHGLPFDGNQLVEVHPHLGNAVINLNLFQYRFITNIIRVITNNHSEKINISGYLTVTV